MKYSVKILSFLLCVIMGLAPIKGENHDTSTRIKKVLFIGDSMTGWLAERMGAFGNENDFKVATVIWDGSTIKKWANTSSLQKIIDAQAPDLIFISLGMNELFERNPQTRLLSDVKKIITTIGNRPYVWIGPPSWPGKSQATICEWLKSNVGANHYFDSENLTLKRQGKNNPHPTKAAAEQWMDSVVKWIPRNTDIQLKNLVEPATGAMKRGETFIYKKMNETL